jgi:hypothetical protein
MVADAGVTQLAVVVPVPARVDGVLPPRPLERYPAPALRNTESQSWDFRQRPCVSDQAVHLSSLTSRQILWTRQAARNGGGDCWTLCGVCGLHPAENSTAGGSFPKRRLSATMVDERIASTIHDGRPPSRAN